MSEVFRQERGTIGQKPCLIELMYQAEGRNLNAADDVSLINQLNALRAGRTVLEGILKCPADGCEYRCSITTDEEGVIAVMSQDGDVACERQK